MRMRMPKSMWKLLNLVWVFILGCNPCGVYWYFQNTRTVPNKKEIFPPGSWDKQKEGDHKGYGRLQCLCIQVTFLLNVNIISKPNSFQEIVRNWEGYYTTVHVRRSSTNHNWETKNLELLNLSWNELQFLNFSSFTPSNCSQPHQCKHSGKYFPIHSKCSQSCCFTTNSHKICSH